MNRKILYLFSIIFLLSLAFAIGAQPTLAYTETSDSVQTPVAFDQAQDQAGEAAPTLCVKYDPYFCYNFKPQDKPQPVETPAVLEQDQGQVGEAAPTFCVKYDPYICYHFKPEVKPQPVQIFAAVNQESGQAKEETTLQPVQTPVALEQERDQVGEAAPKVCVRYDPFICYSFKPERQGDDASQKREPIKLIYPYS